MDTTPLKELFQAMDVPVFKLEVEDLHDLPIGTINVMTPCDDREWCKKHDHGKLPVWHDYCARVMACKELKVQPTVQEVNAQCALWQKRCDELLDWLLCDYCIQEKDDAFAEGLGLDWVTDNCDGKCRIVKYIFERAVTHPGWDISYQGELPECMRKWV